MGWWHALRSSHSAQPVLSTASAVLSSPYQTPGPLLLLLRLDPDNGAVRGRALDLLPLLLTLPLPPRGLLLAGRLPSAAMWPHRWCSRAECSAAVRSVCARRRRLGRAIEQEALEQGCMRRCCSSCSLLRVEGSTAPHGCKLRGKAGALEQRARAKRPRAPPAHRCSLSAAALGAA